MLMKVVLTIMIIGAIGAYWMLLFPLLNGGSNRKFLSSTDNFILGLPTVVAIWLVKQVWIKDPE